MVCDRTAGFVLVKVLAPAFAHQTPDAIPLCGDCRSCRFDRQFGHVSVAWSWVWLWQLLSAWTQAGLLFVGLQRRGWIKFDTKLTFVLLRTLIACGVLVFGLTFGMAQTGLNSGQWLEMPGSDRAMQVLVTCFVGGIGYGLTLLLLGVRPRHFLAATD